jgi:aminopeptidase N
MIRLLIFMGLLIPYLQSEGQVTQACPVHLPDGGLYENPLYEKWLSAYDVKFYGLDLQVSNTTTEISGTATLLVEAVREIDTVVLELQEALTVTKVETGDAVDDAEFTQVNQITHANGVLYIPLERSRTQGEPVALRIEYGGEAGQDRGFFAGITTARDPAYGFDVTYTLSEPLNAKDWFPAKQVLQDKIDSVHMNLRCANHLMVASNGILEEVEEGADDMHTFRWRTRYPMAYYLISFAVADYRDFSFNAPLSGEGDSVLVQNYIYDTAEVLTDWEEDIRRTAPMITSFSELLMDYPFAAEKYGHAMAPMGGGMEHQTMTTIQNFNFFLVAHELAHQWFGDHITCGNWQDIWINEGFASYMEYVAAQRLIGQEFADDWMNNAMSIALGETQGSVYVPAGEVEDVYRLFDYGLSYKKGAILLHMIRYHLNDDEVFFGALRNYLDQYGEGLATGEDFRGVLEAHSGIDFSCFFEQWYYGEGFPRFQVQWSQEGDSLKILSEQTAVVPAVTPFFRTPFDVEIRYMDGSSEKIRMLQDAPLVDTSIAVSGPVEDLVFDPDGWLLKSVSVVNLIPEYGVEKQYVIGPNPVFDELRVKFQNNPSIERVEITNMAGQKVWSAENMDNPVRMDLSDLSPGTYLLVMYDDTRTYREQFVKVQGKR